MVKKNKKEKKTFSQEFPHVSLDTQFSSEAEDLLGCAWIKFFYLNGESMQISGKIRQVNIKVHFSVVLR